VTDESPGDLVELAVHDEDHADQALGDRHELLPPSPGRDDPSERR
jgi:hypothetical protein